MEFLKIRKKFLKYIYIVVIDMWKNACNILAFYEKNISSQDTKEK